jgi:hypothetical protein
MTEGCDVETGYSAAVEHPASKEIQSEIVKRERGTAATLGA